MRRLVAIVVVGVVPLLAAGALRAQNQAPPAAPTNPSYPAWAYAIVPPAPAAAPGAAPAQAPAPDTSVKSLPGSTQQFTLQQIRNMFGPADWFPGDHPAMPDVVAKGRQPDVRACGLCHYPNGKGRPENAGVSGLPVSYFVETMHDFRRDLRKSADARKANTNLMVTIAKGMTEQEIVQAAEYFGSMKWSPWLRVVEANTVPKTRIAGGMHLRLEGEATEPIGMRIIETPENTEHTELLRDPRSGFIAYAPVGSLKKGETLVMTGGNGRTVACTVCHGADLRGMGPVPGLAGRSPSYIARQMYDMQQGARRGQWTELMKPVVQKLTAEDFVSISAYLASRMP
jgi:cytochrome c553